MRRDKRNVWLGRSDGSAVPRRTLMEIGYARPSLITYMSKLAAAKNFARCETPGASGSSTILPGSS